MGVASFATPIVCNYQYLDHFGTYTYDRFGNVQTMEDALGKTENYTYSALGRLQSKTDRNGVTTTYGYDALGRVIETVTSLGDVVSYTYAMTGQVLTEQNNNQLTEYAYDELGRVISVWEEELSVVKVPTPYTVILDPAEGTVEETEIAAWDNVKTRLPIPVRMGYTFEGWYNGGTFVTKTAPVQIGEDCTLTAKWTVNTYTLVFHGSGGEPATGEDKISNGFIEGMNL